MPPFLVTFTGGQVREKSSVNLYDEGEQAHNDESGCCAATNSKPAELLLLLFVLEDRIAVKNRITDIRTDDRVILIIHDDKLLLKIAIVVAVVVLVVALFYVLINYICFASSMIRLR